MNAYDAAAQYRELGSRGAHPVGLVVRLYDALVEDFRRAAEAVNTGKIERRTVALNHALLILAELEGTLDHERGGQVAKHLKGLYQVARPMIIEANLHSSIGKIERLASLFLPVRQAWRQAERELCEGAAERANAARPEAMAAESDDAVAVGTRSWSV